jgi:hypothetical protein
MTIPADHERHADDHLALASFATRAILEGIDEYGDIVNIRHVLSMLGWEQTPEMSLLLWLIQELRANPSIKMTDDSDDEGIEFEWHGAPPQEVLAAMAPEYARWDSPAEIVKRNLAFYAGGTDDH